MSLIVPHYRRAAKRHNSVPYLWRIGCSCGWYALAPSEDRCNMAFAQHQFEEEPFPSEEVFGPENSHDRKD